MLPDQRMEKDSAWQVWLSAAHVGDGASLRACMKKGDGAMPPPS
jgi:hypothetical protein